MTAFFTKTCPVTFQRVHHVDPLMYMTEWFMCLLARCVLLLDLRSKVYM